jgi:flotillin
MFADTAIVPLLAEIPDALYTAGILAVLVICLLFWAVGRYRKCPSNKILVVYGRTGSGASKCIHGGGCLIWPVVQSYAYLDLEPFVVPVDLTNALSQENIRVAVPTTVTAALSTQPGIMQNAAIRLLGLSRQQIQATAQDIIVGQMRAVIATMKINEINTDRQAFMARVNEAVSVELEKIGLALINVNIRDIEDESGYIKALGRKAAAAAINTANMDVAEQERIGQIGVAERQRDTRVAVAAATADAEIGEANAAQKKRQQIAAANAEAEIGEANAAKNKRAQTAVLDAQAVNAETQAGVQKAEYNANQKVAQETARGRSEAAARVADGEIRVAQETAAKKAEDARALREQSRLNAEIVVPAQADQQKVLIAAEAQKKQAIFQAEGQAAATLANMKAAAEGLQAQLEGKAQGYRQLVSAARDPQAVATLLLIEKLADAAGIQAKAIANLPIEKIVIWDTGGNGSGLAGLGQRLMGALPPLHELARQIGLELPGYLGTMKSRDGSPTETTDGPATPRPASPPTKKGE